MLSVIRKDLIRKVKWEKKHIFAVHNTGKELRPACSKAFENRCTVIQIEKLSLKYFLKVQDVNWVHLSFINS